VFLRTLEYFPGVIFMTTNQVDQIDDAIASRAVARIRYDVPTPQNQARIWEVLAETAGAEIDSGLIKQIVAEYPSLSGRDVKNLLKLAMLVSAAEKKPITMETISFVKSFKPTRDLARDEGGSAELES
jgi:AAA+ superfamily predicted ATPase